MAMLKNTWVGGVLLLVLAACNTPPPQPWLRFQPSGRHDWVAGPDGLWLARLHGVDVQLDLNRTQTRIQVTVTNSTTAPLDVRMGPEASSPKGAIGELLLRQIDAAGGTGGPDMVPYNTLQRVVVDAGWRGTFYIDSPLGRDPVLGQFFVFTVEGRNAKGEVERRSIPLLATNAGTKPIDGR